MLLYPSRLSSGLSSEMGDAVPEFRFAHDRGDDSDCVDHAENQAHVDAGVFDALPGKPAERYSCLHPAVQAFRP